MSELGRLEVRSTPRQVSLLIREVELLREEVNKGAAKARDLALFAQLWTLVGAVGVVIYFAAQPLGLTGLVREVGLAAVGLILGSGFLLAMSLIQDHFLAKELKSDLVERDKIRLELETMRLGYKE